MAGPLAPYGTYMAQMLMRNLPIAQQRIMGLLGGAAPEVSRRGGRVMDAAQRAAANAALPMGRAATPAAGLVAANAATAPRYETAPGPSTMNPLANRYGLGAQNTPDMNPLANSYGVGRSADTEAGMDQMYAKEIAAANAAMTDPEAGMDQMYAKEIAAANAAMTDPEAGMDQMYAKELAAANARSRPSRGPSAPVPPARPSEEDIKKLRALQGYAKDYQSNSLPVFNEGKINWATDAAGYGGEDNFGGDAADFFRADGLRRAVPGLLGM